jgi:trk system potassium uptake protein TrkH
MLLKPDIVDVRHIAYDLGKVLSVVAIAAVVPLLWAIGTGEWSSAGSFVFLIGIAVVLSAGGELARPATQRHRIDWSHGMVVVALTWLIVPALGAIPLLLSGHYARALDAYFDAMSGITTSGLTVVQDLDHMPESVNLWRHTLHFLGGQGIVLAALTFFAASGTLALYQGEGRDERIFPSVTSTARFIWLVSVYHGVASIFVLGGVLDVFSGFEPRRALFHAYNIFVAAFDTGGFSPQTAGFGYYHSPVIESVTMVIMLAGALSFGMHYALWQRQRGLIRNLEVRTFAGTIFGTVAVTIVGLVSIGLLTDPKIAARQGLFHVISAHTGTGFATVSPNELSRWTGLAYAGMCVAMALGGMGSSTAGGVKSLRVGLTLKAMGDTIREALLPERAVISRGYWQNGRQHLTHALAQSVMAISLLYVALYLLGAGVAYVLGNPLSLSLFESVSAAANVGLSVGITHSGMNWFLELVMVLQMWVGRLEFVSVFALVGFAVAYVRGK